MKEYMGQEVINEAITEERNRILGHIVDLETKYNMKLDFRDFIKELVAKIEMDD